MKSPTLVLATSSQNIELKKKKLDKLIKKHSPFQLVDFIMRYKRGDPFVVNIINKVYKDKLKISSEHHNDEIYDNVFIYMVNQSLTLNNMRANSLPSRQNLSDLFEAAFDYVNHNSGNFLDELEKNLQRHGDQILNLQKLTHPFYRLISLFAILQKSNSEDFEITEIEKVLNYNIYDFCLSYLFVVLDIISSSILKNQQYFLNDYSFEPLLNKTQNFRLREQIKIWIDRLTHSREEVTKFSNIKGIKANPEYENFTFNPMRVFPLICFNRNRPKYQILFVNLIANSVGQIFISHMDDMLKNNPKIKVLFHKKFGEFFELYHQDLMKACMNSNHQIIMKEDLKGYFSKKEQKQRNDEILLENKTIVLFEYKKGLRIRREVINNNEPNNDKIMLEDIEKALAQLESTKKLITEENKDHPLTKDKEILKFIVVHDEIFSFIGNFKFKLAKDASVISSHTITCLQPYLKQGLITFKKLHELLKEANEAGELGAVTKIEEELKDKIKDQSDVFMKIKYKELLDIKNTQ